VIVTRRLLALARRARIRQLGDLRRDAAARRARAETAVFDGMFGVVVGGDDAGVALELHEHPHAAAIARDEA
jgi:hypothetical protein